MNNETTVHKSLAAALLAAQRDISMLQKDSTQTAHGYDYVSADGTISQTRAILHRHSLVFRAGGPQVQWLGAQTETKPGKGGTSYEMAVPRALVTIGVNLTHADTGEQIEETHSLIAEADRGRPIDKAILGVETTLIGYALRGLLNLPRFNNENEVSGRDDTEYDPKAIGEETAAALMAAMTRVGMSIQYVRHAAVKAGADEAVIKGKLATWPKEYAERVQGLIDKFTAKQRGQADALKSLPQRKAVGGDGPTIDTSTSQIEPPRPTPQPTPAPARPGTPASNGKPKAVSNGRVIREAGDDFAEEMSRLM